MIKYQDVVLDPQGNVVSGASVTIYNTGTLVKPTIYSDEGVTVSANPLTSSATGSFSFYVADGDYDIVITKAGFTTVTRTDTTIGVKASTVSIVDAAGKYTGTNVETALTELKTTAELAATTGAGLIGIADAGSKYTGSTVEAALQEGRTAAELSATTGAALVGIADAGAKFSGGTVEAALQETRTSAELSAAGGAALIGTTPAGTLASATVQAALNELDTEKTAVADLASTASGKGAALIGINDVGSLIAAATVEAALQEAFTAINTKLSKLTANTLTQDGTQHVEIQKDGTPLNYGTTRASWVLQHRDTASGATNELIPGAVWQFRSSGNGTVTAGSELSQTIWQGLYSFMEKTGDGSAHSFTAIGELGAYGAGGYNELGLCQGEGTNKGSALGTMSGVEMLLKDSPDAGVNTYSTKMQAIVGRIAKYNPTVRKSYHFYGSSEGTQYTNGIIGVNPSGNKFQRGFDFEGADFNSGQFGLAPNNTFLGWLNSTGSAKSILGLNSSNNTYLAFQSTSNKGVLSDHSFNSVLEWDDNANDGVLIFVGGSVKRIGQGAIDSGGVGFRQLIVAN